MSDRVLLPDCVVPIKYNLSLTPDFDACNFDGTVAIEVDVKTATRTITVHAKQLSIKSASFVSSGGDVEQQAAQILDHRKLTTVTFTFPEEIPTGSGKLTIAFTGTLNDQMAGFYRSAYKDVKGQSKIMASTQLEALDARRCFPCWDEPAVKAVFSITLIVPQHLTAISNMPALSSKTLPGSKTELVFEDTPKMSTYLVAFCVGEFDFSQARTKDGVGIRVFAPPGKGSLTAFALRIAVQNLEFYNDFFESPYPLPKLDMIAITEFSCGAMENWGLVTYREVDLLIDEETASSQQKQRVASVVAHELAHQWFGNLVTMEWWDDLWLNEGFATWMQNFAIDRVFPDWRLWDQFAVEGQALALHLDSLRTSHPIQVPIQHAEEVEEVFDRISYFKGACVVQMAFAALGEADFRKGLVDYMQRYQYKNTVTKDLWDAWGRASGKPVAELMSSWTEQMGFSPNFDARKRSTTAALLRIPSRSCDIVRADEGNGWASKKASISSAWALSANPPQQAFTTPLNRLAEAEAY
eukprot:NODE_1098_length_1706_cov_26.131563_g974_i0.p1 GENE.NODE_1098_length_1706_cov_26.131563_g974_i0~~NODE_1098_length_1706_cov_26.131563_g974_i0.p1  ORF type:complete len:547 (+),score=123.18 NODE_1098_length_1706_cov_26.131563_g974_i0:69-1643(+)